MGVMKYSNKESNVMNVTIVTIGKEEGGKVVVGAANEIGETFNFTAPADVMAPYKDGEVIKVCFPPAPEYCKNEFKLMRVWSALVMIVDSGVCDV